MPQNPWIEISKQPGQQLRPQEIGKNYFITSYHMLSCDNLFFTCYHVLSCLIMSYRVLSCLIMSYHVLSCLIRLFTCYHLIACDFFHLLWPFFCMFLFFQFVFFLLLGPWKNGPWVGVKFSGSLLLGPSQKMVHEWQLSLVCPFYLGVKSIVGNLIFEIH